MRYDENGLPLIEDCVKNSFMGYYTSPEVASAFDSFYKNEEGIQDKFILFWEFTVSELANNEYIIGYDLLNEPWPANFYYEPSLLYDANKFDNEVLQSFYNSLSAKIRQID
jgi:endoglycosylceramidase